MDIQTKFHKKFLSAKKPLRIVGAHDGLGAKLIEQHGFDGIWASGLEISASHCVPDANILTMTQYLERTHEMCLSTYLPVIADVDTAYGNFNNADHMIKLYEDAGVAAVVIEDKLFPKKNSLLAGRQELDTIPEFCGKLEAACLARKNKNGMLIIARIEALIAGYGLKEALRRAEAYIEAGADGILIHSKSKEPAEILEFLKKWNKHSPIVLVPTTYPSLSYKDMTKLGVNMIIYANQCLRASIKTIHYILKIINKEKSTMCIEKEISSVEEIFELQGMTLLKEREKRFNITVNKLAKKFNNPQSVNQ